MLTDEQYQFLLKVAHGMRDGESNYPEDSPHNNLFMWSFKIGYHKFSRDGRYTRILTDKGRAAMREYETKGQTNGQRNQHARRSMREKL